MEKKKVSVEVVLKHDHTKTSRIMEITTDEAGVKNLADWVNMKSNTLKIETQRFDVDNIKIEQKPRHGYLLGVLKQELQLGMTYMGMKLRNLSLWMLR